MTNAGNKKLLALLVTLVLLAAGLIAMGSTFATQLVLDDKGAQALDKNLNFDVSVNCYDGNGYNAPMLTDAAVFTSDTYWCPGQTQIVYFAVENNENFIVKTTMDMVVSANGFDDMLRYAVIRKDLKAATDQPANWTEFVTLAGSSAPLAIATNPVFSEIDIAPNTTEYFALAIHMQEEASSHYQNKELQMKFQFRVDANEKGTFELTSGE